MIERLKAIGYRLLVIIAIHVILGKAAIHCANPKEIWFVYKEMIQWIISSDETVFDNIEFE